MHMTHEKTTHAAAKRITTARNVTIMAGDSHTNIIPLNQISINYVTYYMVYIESRTYISRNENGG